MLMARKPRKMGVSENLVPPTGESLYSSYSRLKSPPFLGLSPFLRPKLDIVGSCWFNQSPLPRLLPRPQGCKISWDKELNLPRRSHRKMALPRRPFPVPHLPGQGLLTSCAAVDGGEGIKKCRIFHIEVLV